MAIDVSAVAPTADADRMPGSSADAFAAESAVRFWLDTLTDPVALPESVERTTMFLACGDADLATARLTAPVMATGEAAAVLGYPLSRRREPFCFVETGAGVRSVVADDGTVCRFSWVGLDGVVAAGDERLLSDDLFGRPTRLNWISFHLGVDPNEPELGTCVVLLSDDRLMTAVSHVEVRADEIAGRMNQFGEVVGLLRFRDAA